MFTHATRDPHKWHHGVSTSADCKSSERSTSHIYALGARGSTLRRARRLGGDYRPVPCSIRILPVTRRHISRGEAFLPPFYGSTPHPAYSRSSLYATPGPALPATPPPYSDALDAYLARKAVTHSSDTLGANVTTAR